MAQRLSDSEILIAINNILQPEKKQVLNAGPKSVRIRVSSPQRAELQQRIIAQLDAFGVRYTTDIVKSESSFPVTNIRFKDNSNLRIVYKKLGGGSGAGAALTKLAESSQALYAALVFNVLKRPMTNKDVNLDNFQKALPTAITDEKFDSMVNKLPDDWVNSSIAGANALWRRYGNKAKFTFHRGSPQVSQIEGTFTAINKQEKAFGNLNKWSPADIYMIANGFDVNNISKEKTLKGLNVSMWEALQANKLIGVSLKKITGSGSISNMNFPTDRKQTSAQFRGSTTNMDAMDGYIKWGAGNNERIQFRSFGGETSLTGWQGEIKGASANQGKVSLGPINFVLKTHGMQQLPESKESARLAEENSIQHCTNIANLMIKYGIADDLQGTAEMIQQKSNKYRYSKYLVMLLLTTVEGTPKATADEFVQDLYLYASSQASYSAPYIKLQ
jgi:hypothetical protein